MYSSFGEEPVKKLISKVKNELVTGMPTFELDETETGLTIHKGYELKTYELRAKENTEVIHCKVEIPSGSTADKIATLTIGDISEQIPVSYNGSKVDMVGIVRNGSYAQIYIDDNYIATYKSGSNEYIKKGLVYELSYSSASNVEFDVIKVREV